MKKKPLHLHVRQYHAWVVGLLGWEPNAASNYVWKHWQVKEPFTTGYGRCLTISRDNHFVAVIHLARWKNDPPHIAVLGHECLHASLFILNFVNQGVDTRDHEHLTYLFQDVFGGMLAIKNKGAL